VQKKHLKSIYFGPNPQIPSIEMRVGIGSLGLKKLADFGIPSNIATSVFISLIN
jgi:hypothetical protein